MKRSIFERRKKMHFYSKYITNMLLMYLKAQPQLKSTVLDQKLIHCAAFGNAACNWFNMHSVIYRRKKKQKNKILVMDDKLNIACIIKNFKGMQNIHSAINVSCKLWWNYNFTFEYMLEYTAELCVIVLRKNNNP